MHGLDSGRPIAVPGRLGGVAAAPRLVQIFYDQRCQVRMIRTLQSFQQNPPALGRQLGLHQPVQRGVFKAVEILEGLLEATSGAVEILGRRWGEHDDELRQRLGITDGLVRLSVGIEDIQETGGALPETQLGNTKRFLRLRPT